MFIGPSLEVPDGYVFVVESRIDAKHVNVDLVRLARDECLKRGIANVPEIHDEPPRTMPIDPPVSDVK